MLFSFFILLLVDICVVPFIPLYFYYAYFPLFVLLWAFLCMSPGAPVHTFCELLFHIQEWSGWVVQHVASRSQDSNALFSTELLPVYIPSTSHCSKFSSTLYWQMS